MAHPDNEPGKSYDEDDRRRAAALKAVAGLPTEWLERGLVSRLYEFTAILALLDTMSEKRDGYVLTPSGWWSEHIRGGLDALNRIADPTRIQ